MIGLNLVKVFERDKVLYFLFSSNFYRLFHQFNVQYILFVTKQSCRKFGIKTMKMKKEL